jgi:enoyl-CoA hydratase/carnithine racemase
MSTPELVRVTVDAGVAVLTLDNPPLNVVTLELTRRLRAALDRLAADPEARVLIVTGAGSRAFCAGSDVREFPSVSDDVVRKKLAPENDAYSRVDDFPKPTIAALNGLAYGGGLELAVCCDILIAGADVRLALPEVKLGVLPGSGGTVRVPRRIGEGRAKELMFTGDPIDAETARSWGLVNRVVPPRAGAGRGPRARAHAGRAAESRAPAHQGGHGPRPGHARGRGDPADAGAVRGDLPDRGRPRGRARFLREGAASLAPPLAPGRVRPAAHAVQRAPAGISRGATPT